MTDRPPTARDLRDKLADLGVHGVAADAVVKATAHVRHDARIAFAVEAALAAADTQFRGELDPALLIAPSAREAVAAALCVADVLGVGGTQGMTGDATMRLPCFRACGKGRKQASDGAAWSAAIAGALWSLRRPPPPGQTRRLVVTVTAPSDGDPPPYIAAALGDEVPCVVDLPLEWAWVMARYGLAAAFAREDGAGVPVWPLPAEDALAGVEFTGRAADWAALVNMLDEVQREARAEQRATLDALDAGDPPTPYDPAALVTLVRRSA